MADAVDGMFEELRSAAARLEDLPAGGEPEPQEQPSEALPGVRATPAAVRQLPAEAVAAAERLLTAVTGDTSAAPGPPATPDPDAPDPDAPDPDAPDPDAPNTAIPDLDAHTPGQLRGEPRGGPPTQQHPPPPPVATSTPPPVAASTPPPVATSTPPPAPAEGGEGDTTIAAPTPLSALALTVAGAVRPLPRGPVIVGRDPGPAGFRVDDPEVSRRHLELRPTAVGLQAADLGSLNGTRLRRGGNEQVVDAAGTVLRPGDQLVTGEGTVLVSLRRHDQ